jgi:uncharacterized damage-inducible protein DinB
MMKWFDRKFEFDLPGWMYPNVVERLRGTPVRVKYLVEGVSEDILGERQGDRWSIKENIGHLTDLEPLWLGRVEDILQGKESLRDADLSNSRTHGAAHNDSSLDDLLVSLEEARHALVERVERLDDTAAEMTAIHPRLLTPMRLIDLLFFVAEHDDHHLAAITRIKLRG